LLAGVSLVVTVALLLSLVMVFLAVFKDLVITEPSVVVRVPPNFLFLWTSTGTFK
jgi:hypothetical protein